MANKFVWVLIALMSFADIPHTRAMGTLVTVTKETQAKLGVEFTLSAVRVSDTAVLVRMEIPKTGKLKELQRVTLDIGSDRPGVPASPLVSADLQTAPGKHGSLVVSFQLSPEMANQCSIRLGPLAPAIPMSYEYYSVELKGYVTDNKSAQNRHQDADVPIQWGEASEGFQLGAREVHGPSNFKIGDTVRFQAFGRNLTGRDVDLSVGNYWKVNCKVQVQTLDGKPVYMERDQRNQATEVAGYRLEPFVRGAVLQISDAALKISDASRKQEPARMGDEDAWVEAVPLKPGRYRVRIVSWRVFGPLNSEPASGWIPIEVRNQ
jgi:hypothetical protein